MHFFHIFHLFAVSNKDN